MGSVNHISVELKDKLRNGQLDNYGMSEDKVWFQIKNTGDDAYNMMLLIHALVEFMTTHKRGIKLDFIDAFDNEHPESEEPGDEVDCPYRNEHGLAVGIERILCAYMNIPWKVYEEALIKSLGDDQ